MIKTVMIATVIAGIATSMVWPSLATVSIPSSVDQTLSQKKTLNTKRVIDGGNEQLFHSQQYFVQRQSSKPPGESRSGRASSSPAGSVPESKRDSGKTLDPSEEFSHPGEGSTSHQRPEESMVTPKREEDPLEGSRKSQPATKRRGGVVK